MNLDPTLMEIIVCPDCHGTLARSARSWSARAAAWPTRCATTSRCCWSTRPVGRTDGRRRCATWFDESRLDDEAALTAADPPPARARRGGARVRREAVEAAPGIAAAVATAATRPARAPSWRRVPTPACCRAVLEPWCPVPFVAWPGPALPGWAGGLDLVVVLAPDGSDRGTAAAVAEAVRRGCQVVVACPDGSLVARHAEGRWSTIVPTVTRDQLATAVVLLEYLDQVGLGPRADHGDVAERPRRRRRRLLAPSRPRRQPRQDAGHRPGRTPTPSSGAGRRSRPAPRGGSPRPSGARRVGPRSPVTPSTCCR